MKREEIVNNIGYQLTRAAVDYVEKHEFADGMDCFEAGAEWMQKKMIDKACEWLGEKLYEHTNMGEFVGTLSRYVYKKDTINQFRKAMED